MDDLDRKILSLLAKNARMPVKEIAEQVSLTSPAVSSRIHSRLHEIGLLRCIGMTKGQVYRMFVYEGAVFGVLASLLGTMGSLVMLPKFQENWLHTSMPLVLALSCVVCMALAVFTIFLPARAVMKKSPTEIMQINE